MKSIAGIIALITFIGVVEALLKGFVLSVLWGWFAVPLGVPAIGIAGAIGIALLVGMLSHQAGKDDREIEEIIGASLGGPILVLIIGAIVKLFM